MASCDGDGLCYVKNDAPFPFVGNLAVRTTEFSTAAVTVLEDRQVSLPAGAGAILWFASHSVAAVNGTTHVLEAVVVGADGREASKNVIPFAEPGKMRLAKSMATVVVADEANADGTVDIDVSASHVAMYVTLTTLAHGRFSDNAFLLGSNGKLQTVVQFIPFGKLDLSMLKSSLRVEDVSSYQQ
jgi:hypothetical protein